MQVDARREHHAEARILAARARRLLEIELAGLGHQQLDEVGAGPLHAREAARNARAVNGPRVEHRDHPDGIGLAHDFTAPAVSPPTSRFWTRRKRMVDRQRDQRAAGGEQAPLDRELADEELQRDGDRAHGLAGQHHGEEIFVPRGDEDVDAGRDDARHHQRQDDEADRLQPARAVDHRRLVEILRDRVEIARQHPDREGDREGRMAEDDAEERVDQPEASASAGRAG